MPSLIYLNGGNAKLIGDALVENVLSGKTFYNNDSKNLLIGTMANNGAVQASIGLNQSYTIPAGYHNGSGTVTNSIVNKGAITGSVGVGGTYSSTQNGYVTTISVTGPSLSGNAGVGDVLSGKTFYSNSGTKQTGTMVNRGTINTSIGIGGSYTIPQGYHSGSGKVTNSIANKGAITGSVGMGGTYSSTQNGYVTTIKITGPTTSGTFNATTRATNIDMGSTNVYRYVTTTSVPNTNSGTYTYPANSTGGTVDLGATNTYRYVNAANVYAKGKADGDIKRAVRLKISGSNRTVWLYLNGSQVFYAGAWDDYDRSWTI